MVNTNHIIIVSLISLFSVTWYSSAIMDDLHEKNMRLIEINDELKRQMDMLEFNVTVTMYNPTKGQTDSTPNELADGTKINPHKASSYRYIALSRDLLARWGGPFNYGDYVMLKGTGGYDGVYQVRDTMASKFINRVDILRTEGSKQFRFDNATLYRYFKYDNVTLHKHEKP